MASVLITDIYNPLLFAASAQEASIITNRFVNSGVLMQSGVLDQHAQGSGNLAELPFFGPLAEAEPNISSDVVATLSTPKNVTTKKMITRKFMKNDSWSITDLASELSLSEPVTAITNRIGKFWATDAEQCVINSLKGIKADNIANDSGDMVNVAAAEATGSVSATTVITDNNVIDTIQTAGDAGNFSLIVMHSVQFRALQKAKLVDWVNQNVDTDVIKDGRIATYLNMRVVVDDVACVPRAGTTSGLVYPVYILKEGAFGLGTGSATVPSELIRVPSAGNGGGETVLHSRVSRIIHPMGFAFISGSVAGNSATYAELALAANWNRVVDRKNVGIAILEVN